MADRGDIVLVGFDGRPGSRDALHLGRTVARALDEELHVAVALPYEPLPLPVEAYDEALEQHFGQLFAAAAHDLGNEFERRELRERSPARALTELAESEPVDVIVIGSSESCDKGRAVPGKVGERLLTGAPCAVAIAPCGYAGTGDGALRKVGVAYDGTAEASRALALGERLARGAGAALRVITVSPTVTVLPSRIGHTGAGYARALREHFGRVLAEAPGKLTGDIEAELVLGTGQPAATLVEFTSELDLIVTGSRGYGPVRRALLGGTSSDLVRAARCPVVVTPR
jgi:nucleotide-binding universal stress UspA family protein